ncbi:hypothetical protein, partial [Klebsiella pneumoniae]|uniref:hypothetical protein n=1 Tax=Klebsiella pneumoniae TaxID=573 RepID=UPI0013D52423
MVEQGRRAALPLGAARIATVTGEVSDLKWTPDGAKLLFVDYRNDHAFVALLAVDGGKLTYM